MPYFESSVGNLRWIRLLSGRHVLQIEILLQYLGFDRLMCPLQVFCVAWSLACRAGSW